jgi:hypothetical protein
MEYEVKIPHVVSKLQCCVTDHVNPRCLSVSQCGSYFAQGYAVTNIFMDTIALGCYGVLILYAISCLV